MDTVGAVYVKVLSDSSDFRRQLKRAGDKAGDEGAVAFGKSFDSHVTKELNKVNLDRILGPKVEKWGREYADRVSRATRNGATIKFRLDDYIDPDELRRLSRQMKVPMDEVAKYIATNIAGATRKGWQDAEREAQKAIAIQEKQWLRYKRWQVDTERTYARLRTEANKKDMDLLEREMRKTAQETQRMLTDAWKGIGEISRYWNREANVLKGIHRGIRVSMARDVDAMSRYWQRLIDKTSKIVAARNPWKGWIRDVRILDRQMGRINNRFRRMGTGGWFDTITNIFGAMILGSYRVGRIVPAAFSKIGDVVSNIGTMIADAASETTKFGRVAGNFGRSMANIGEGITAAFASGPAGLIALGLGLVALEATLGAVVVLVNALAAGVVVLGSALLHAVTMLAVFVPALGAMGVGLAGIVVGGWDAAGAIGALFKAMNESDPKKKAEALKKYEEALKKLGPNARAALRELEPLIGGFDKLKRAAGESLFAGMDKALRKAGPLIDAVKNGLIAVAGAMGDVIDSFLRLGQDSSFMSSFARMWEHSATLIRMMGDTAADVFAGLTHFFDAISPVTERFFGNIADVAEAFREWTSSAANQQTLLSFFYEAEAIAGALWDVLKSLGGSLWDLLTAPATQTATMDFLQFLNTEMEKFRDWINEISENGKLAEWFQRAKEIGLLLWAALKEIFKTMGALFTPEAVGALKFFVLMFISWLKAIQFVVGAIQTLVFVLKNWWNWLKVLGGVLRFIWDLVWEVGRLFINFFKVGPAEAFQRAIDGVRRAVERLVGWIKKIKWPKPPQWMRDAWNNRPDWLFAKGGIVTSATRAMIGEAGPEAVIPLARPLSQIDPSVRGMAATLRGHRSASSVSPTSNRTLNNYITVNSPVSDANALATQIVNRAVALAG